MVALSALWLPILLSAVAVWIASAIIWMALPHHKSDFRGLPDEEGFLEALGKQNPAPAQYMFPYCKDPSAMKDPEVLKKYEKGPIGIMAVQKPGKPNMGKSMVLSFLLNLGIAVVVGYLASRTIAEGTEYLHVFRVTSTTAFLAYVGAVFYPAIWMGRPWSMTFKEVIDGLVYGLITGGFFGWLWP